MIRQPETVGLSEIVYLLLCVTKTDDKVAGTLVVRKCAQPQGPVQYDISYLIIQETYIFCITSV